MRSWPSRACRFAFASFLLLSPAAARGAPTFGDTLAFEVPRAPGKHFAFPGWFGGPVATLAPDSVVLHGGARSARIQRDSTSEYKYSGLSFTLPVWFDGDWITFTAWLRPRAVRGSAVLWMRQDGEYGAMQNPEYAPNPGLTASSDWTRCVLRTRLLPGVTRLTMGVLLEGSGTVNVDDAQVEVDGRPLAAAVRKVPPWNAPRREISDSSLALVTCGKLTPAQAANLALLARVWGFAKYHHPEIAAGRIPWDAALIGALPAVLAARSPASARAAIVAWLDRFPVPDTARAAAREPQEPQTAPPIAWIHDRRALGAELCSRLEHLHELRAVRSEQFYVATARGTGHAVFGSEAAYEQDGCPAVGLRLLALFRLWNVIEYWYPYRDLIGAEWDQVLPRFIPAFVAAGTKTEYELSLAQVLERLQDTHAALAAWVKVVPPAGPAQLPVALRHVDGRFVVFGAADSLLAARSGLKRGDVIEALDGVPVDSIVASCSKYYSASNPAAKMWMLATSLTWGPAGPCRVRVVRDGHVLEIPSQRDSTDRMSTVSSYVHCLPWPGFRLLSPDVAYWNPSQTNRDSCVKQLGLAAGTKCMVVDLRDHTEDYSLASHLAHTPGAFYSGTRCDLANPGAFFWSHSDTMPSIAPRYEGRIVVVVDESTISASEFMTMMLRRAPGAIVVGSTTAGADGNTTQLPLPGGEHAWITGAGVFGPDRRPTQRVGIVPDVVVRPTIAGIAQGHDEVLEAAVRAAIGTDLAILRE